MYSYQKFLEAAMAERGPDHHIWEDNDKVNGRELGELCDLRVPELIDGPGKLRDFYSPGRDVIIKPVYGCSARGVIPLRWEEDVYTNLFTGREMTWDNAVTQALKAKHMPRNQFLLEKNHPDAMRPPWILEELILDEHGDLPYDWKGFVFDGKVEAIKQSKRQQDGSVQVKWYDPQWNTIGNIAPVKKWKHTPKLPLPGNPEGLVKAFEDVATLVDSPFIRVDLYEQGGEVVFGETTPHPTGGGVKFIGKWDAIFGQAWAGAL